MVKKNERKKGRWGNIRKGEEEGFIISWVGDKLVVLRLTHYTLMRKMVCPKRIWNQIKRSKFIDKKKMMEPRDLWPSGIIQGVSYTQCGFEIS